jgi:hypothetical protein
LGRDQEWQEVNLRAEGNQCGDAESEEQRPSSPPQARADSQRNVSVARHALSVNLR